MIYQVVLSRLNGSVLLNTRFVSSYFGKCRIKFLHLSGFTTNQNVNVGYMLLLTSSKILDERPILIGSPITTVNGGVITQGQGWVYVNLGKEYVYENIMMDGDLDLQIGWYSGNNFTPISTSGGNVSVLLTFDIEYMDENKNK